MGGSLRVVVPHRLSAWPLVVGISLLLLLITFLSYPLARHGFLSVILFSLGLGGERNVGAWWSGMLFVLAAVSAFDRAVGSRPARTEYRAWTALAAAFVLLSLDEVAGLHEWLGARGLIYLVPLGALGLALVGYSLTNLRRAKVPLWTLLLGFALLATVPLQELLQNVREWTNPWAYGARAFVEEGTEVAAALLLIVGTKAGLSRLGASRPEPFASLAKFGGPLFWLSLGALPLVIIAAYELNLTGPADWLGSALFLSCALLAISSMQSHTAALPAAALYLLASVGANAVRPDWDPLVLSYSANLRGLFFAALLLAAPLIVGPGRPWLERSIWLALGVVTLLGALFFPHPQVVWSTWPAAVALLCLFIELTAIVGPRTEPPLSAPIEAVAGAVPHDKHAEFSGPF
jgi:hypothetical protein